MKRRNPVHHRQKNEEELGFKKSNETLLVNVRMETCSRHNLMESERSSLCERTKKSNSTSPSIGIQQFGLGSQLVRYWTASQSTLRELQVQAPNYTGF